MPPSGSLAVWLNLFSPREACSTVRAVGAFLQTGKSKVFTWKSAKVNTQVRRSALDSGVFPTASMFLQSVFCHWQEMWFPRKRGNNLLCRCWRRWTESGQKNVIAPPSGRISRLWKTWTRVMITMKIRTCWEIRWRKTTGGKCVYEKVEENTRMN